MRQSRSPTPRHFSSNRGQEQRQRIAIEAARLIVEHGIQDFALAKRKAAERFGNCDTVNLPKNSEIETALREHQRLFRAAQPQLLLQRRTVAREAMRFLTNFEPRLVGSVLEGTADAHSAVCLHVFSDDPQALPLFLADHHIPYDEQTRRLRLDQHRSDDFSVYVFFADGIAIDLTVLPLNLLRQAPLSPIDEHPMQRASLNMLLKLLEETLSHDEPVIETLP